MPHYEYKVVPAPMRGEKVRGIRAPRERFAHTLATLMNQMAVEGWEYQRAETLPCEERNGLFSGKHMVFQNMLVFRRSTQTQPSEDVHRQDLQRHAPAPEPRPAPESRQPEARQPEPRAVPEPRVVPEPPSPAAMAASLLPDHPAGQAPRIAPVDPHRKLRRDDDGVVPPGPSRVPPQGPDRRGE